MCTGFYFWLLCSWFGPVLGELSGAVSPALPQPQPNDFLLISVLRFKSKSDKHSLFSQLHKQAHDNLGNKKNVLFLWLYKYKTHIFFFVVNFHNWDLKSQSWLTGTFGFFTNVRTECPFWSQEQLSLKDRKVAARLDPKISKVLIFLIIRCLSNNCITISCKSKREEGPWGNICVTHLALLLCCISSKVLVSSYFCSQI